MNEQLLIRSLYVHIPFCERKCEYCDFASVAGMRGHAEYVEALRWELRTTAERIGRVELETVFFGGGTPGLLPPDELGALADEVRSCFAVSADAEWTLEANPSSTTEQRAQAWLEAGFNRVSIGVQSLEPDILRFLGRVHGPRRALDALAADLIYAVPGLDDARWTDTVERILELDPGHLSCYELTVEEGTPLADAVGSGAVATVDADTALRQHWAAVDLAATAGYHQYEVSNLARPGQACRHNLVYWRNGFYLGAGVGAHAHLPAATALALGVLSEGDAARAAAVRCWHPREPLEFVRLVAAGELPVTGWETVTPVEREVERVMLGIRLGEGVALSAAAGAEAGRLAGRGLLTLDGDVARATRRGQEVLNELAVRLVTMEGPGTSHLPVTGDTVRRPC